MAQDNLKEQLAKARKEAEERDAQRRAEKLGLDYISLLGLAVQIDALKTISEEEARRLKVAPFLSQNRSLDIAVFSTEDKNVQELFKRLEKQNWRLKIFIASESTLNHIWGFYKYVVTKRPEIVGRIEIEKEFFEKEYSKLTDLKKIKDAVENFDNQKLPIRKLLEIILAGAIANNASDVHFEPEKDAGVLRLRVDGLLHDVVKNLDPKIYETLLERIKLLANLKLNIHEEAQDGRFTISYKDKELELRVSVVPAEYGEVAVLRILDPSAIRPELKELGFRKDDLDIIERQLKEPNGMLLNTGPTGSGKTTTLYAFLSHKYRPEIKIITIEDPIEYHLIGIEQTQIDPEAGYDFANGLQALMRQDPDVILVGEIRDTETASIAIQAALTGHLVFSTVHANSASGAVPRLLDLDVRPASIGPALNLIIAQRLVRRLCSKCKIITEPDNQQLAKINKFLEKLPERVNKKDYQKIEIFASKGCSECSGLGYKGRIAILELMEVGPEFEKAINEEVGEAELQKMALERGMVTMQQDGILKTIAGITTFSEVENITGPINWP
ncbi:MAG: GspE/PulE family protein [bacterium]|nr:GspE/PulE family protein [bacterium]